MDRESQAFKGALMGMGFRSSAGNDARHSIALHSTPARTMEARCGSEEAGVAASGAHPRPAGQEQSAQAEVAEAMEAMGMEGTVESYRAARATPWGSELPQSFQRDLLHILMKKPVLPYAREPDTRYCDHHWHVFGKYRLSKTYSSVDGCSWTDDDDGTLHRPLHQCTQLLFL